MKNRTEDFEREVLPYFFDTSGKLCPKRLSSMMVTIIAWLGALYYGFADEPWQGAPGIIVPLVVIGFVTEVKFVIEQAGHKPNWGGLDPLGWATDYNGHPSTHRVKQVVSTLLGCTLIVVDAFTGEPSSGVTIVAMSLIILPCVFGFLFEVIERRGSAKTPPR